MFDVVTDIPRTDEIEVFLGSVADGIGVSLAPFAGFLVHGHLEGTGLAIGLKEQLAQPRQLVGLGQGLAYLERIAPTGCEGMEMDAR